MGALVSLCVAAACLLFALSLPLGSRPTGQALRRSAGCALVCAFTPAVACAALKAAVGNGVTVGGGLQGIGVVAVVSVTAYLILVLRGRFLPRRRDPGGQRRGGYRFDDGSSASRDDDRPGTWRGEG